MGCDDITDRPNALDALCAALRTVRLRRGMTQVQLAAMLEVTLARRPDRVYRHPCLDHLQRPARMRFLNADLLRELTGHPVRDDYKCPDEPDVLPDADAFVVAPATFNTTNKVAAGISDTLAPGLINEAVGMGEPVIMAPWPNKQLVKHPALPRSVELLTEAGVRFVLDREALPGSGRPRAATFPWAEVHSALAAANDEILANS